MYFPYFVIIALEIGPFIWTNLNPLHPRMFCIKSGWNWHSGSGEDFYNFIDVFSLSFDLPLEIGVALHLNKIESPPPKDALCQLWLGGSWEEDENGSLWLRWAKNISCWTWSFFLPNVACKVMKFTIFVHPFLFLNVTVDSVCLVYAQEKREQSI